MTIGPQIKEHSVRMLLLHGILSHTSSSEHGIGTVEFIESRTVADSYENLRERKKFRKFDFELRDFVFDGIERKRCHLIVKEGIEVVIDLPEYTLWKDCLWRFASQPGKVLDREHELLHLFVIGVDRTFLGRFPTVHYDDHGSRYEHSEVGLEMFTNVGLCQVHNEDIAKAKLRFR